MAVLLFVGAPMVLAPAAGAQELRTSRAAFGFTGTEETYTVPAGINWLVIEAAGGSGAGSGAPGGDGNVMVTQHPVTPGETLAIRVGGQGVGTAGGWNGGGGAIGGGGGGGGQTDVFRSGPRTMANLLVASGGGGGGGGAGIAAAGRGGSATGAASDGQSGGTPGDQGRRGTTAAGGAGGTAGAAVGGSGGVHVGGAGAGLGGGGGAGWFGGGGGASTGGFSGGGGGGGASQTSGEELDSGFNRNADGFVVMRGSSHPLAFAGGEDSLAGSEQCGEDARLVGGSALGGQPFWVDADTTPPDSGEAWVCARVLNVGGVWLWARP